MLLETGELREMPNENELIMSQYEIIEEAGRGAMGVVYKALDKRLDRTVALKELLIDQNLSEHEKKQLIERFYREAQAAGKISHPNIVTIYNFGEDSGRYFIAMEFLTGQSIADILEQHGVYDSEQAVEIAASVCEALDCAHREGIVHRYIKPANIMLTADGRIKVADFGIARMTSSGTMTQAGTVIGSPGYMSPEQISGQKVDGRTDIFSLGVILYQLVTGEKPFGGDTITTIIYKIINQNPVPPRSINIQIPDYLEQIIFRALAKDPNQRYQNAAQMLHDLRNPGNMAATAQFEQSTAARQDQTAIFGPQDQGTLYSQQDYNQQEQLQPQPGNARRKALIGILAVTGLAIIIGIAVLVFNSARQPNVSSSGSNAVLPPGNATDSGSLAPLSVNNAASGKLSNNTNQAEPTIQSTQASPDTGEVPFDVQFSAKVLANSTAVYNWDFGDGTKSNEESPAHTFETPGKHQVLLTVADASGKEATQTITITANPKTPPVAVQQKSQRNRAKRKNDDKRPPQNNDSSSGVNPKKEYGQSGPTHRGIDVSGPKNDF